MITAGKEALSSHGAGLNSGPILSVELWIYSQQQMADFHPKDDAVLATVAILLLLLILLCRNQ